MSDASRKWGKENLVTLSARVPVAYANRLRGIADKEEVSIHRIIINLLDTFMDDYEKED